MLQRLERWRQNSIRAFYWQDQKLACSLHTCQRCHRGPNEPHACLDPIDRVTLSDYTVNGIVFGLNRIQALKSLLGLLEFLLELVLLFLDLLELLVLLRQRVGHILDGGGGVLVLSLAVGQQGGMLGIQLAELLVHGLQFVGLELKLLLADAQLLLQLFDLGQ